MRSAGEIRIRRAGALVMNMIIKSSWGALLQQISRDGGPKKWCSGTRSGAGRLGYIRVRRHRRPHLQTTSGVRPPTGGLTHRTADSARTGCASYAKDFAAESIPRHVPSGSRRTRQYPVQT